MMKDKIVLLLLILLLTNCSYFVSKKLGDRELSPQEIQVLQKTQSAINDLKNIPPYNDVVRHLTVDSVFVYQQNIQIYFNKYLSYLPFRVRHVDFLYDHFAEQFGWRYRNHSLDLFTLEQPIEQLVPNYYRNDSSAIDISRKPLDTEPKIPLVKRLSKPYAFNKGLQQRYIALWHSHGWYYNNNWDRWEWQRPRLFQTVEDLFPFGFVVPYLVPMLENAGATVFLPRERDWQTHEVIVDQDSSTHGSQYTEKNPKQIIKIDTTGFGLGQAPYEIGENPFKYGSYQVMKNDTVGNNLISWIPSIPESGEYSVYISYQPGQNNVTDARYTVYHCGGKTEFSINQTMGGGTWIYLGKFKFRKGLNSKKGKVVLSNKSSQPGRVITADAVKFGGGMGDVQRGHSISHRPRFVEGARYYLQYAGMPDTLIYDFNDNKNDYNDDYTSRGEWVNYLVGRPSGPNKNRQEKGLGIPIDLSFSFHTDAGITDGKDVIGSLSIYSLVDSKGKYHFPTGYSRLANRDLADIVQTEIVSDIRNNYFKYWNRRPLYVGKYSEAYRPNVPSMLLELLSHQNFQDMKFGMNPKFKFDVSRSIYKGMLKYLSDSRGEHYVVQPLPVDHFHISFTGNQGIILKWQAVKDPDEPTASPDKYIVYTRVDSMGFDNGVMINDNQFVFDQMEPNVQYSFKITAVNEGGESFPSEILSACIAENAKDTVMIVNNFDRIAAPATVEKGDFQGFANFIDEGVPYKYDIGYTGSQHNFDKSSKWLTNDYPGWGASHGNYETKVIAGNRFDYPYIHGKALKELGYSYISASDESVESNEINLTSYNYIDMIYGEEKATKYSPVKDSTIYHTFSDKMMAKIKAYCKSGGNLFMSGAYLGSDNFKTPKDSSKYTDFTQNVLKYNLATDHASKSGKFYFSVGNREVFHYNNQLDDQLYKLEAPDAIDPRGGAETILRFMDNDFSAGIYYGGKQYNLIITTVPLETILTDQERVNFMNRIFNLLNK